jgi:hypothetical protein
MLTWWHRTHVKLYPPFFYVCRIISCVIFFPLRLSPSLIHTPTSTCRLATHSPVVIYRLACRDRQLSLSPASTPIAVSESSWLFWYFVHLLKASFVTNRKIHCSDVWVKELRVTEEEVVSHRADREIPVQVGVRVSVGSRIFTSPCRPDMTASVV